MRLFIRAFAAFALVFGTLCGPLPSAMEPALAAGDAACPNPNGGFTANLSTTTLLCDANGYLDVNVKVGGGAGGGSTYNATFGQSTQTNSFLGLGGLSATTGGVFNPVVVNSSGALLVTGSFSATTTFPFANTGGATITANSFIGIGGSSAVSGGSYYPLVVSSSGAARVDGSAVTQPISAGSLPLPAGAATSALQPAINGDGGAQVHLQNASIPVTGTFYQTTQPVSGTLGISSLPALAAGSNLVGSVGAQGTYNSSAPTLTNGQASALQLDTNGNLNVNVKVGGGSSTGGTYNSTPPTITSGSTASLQLDTNGNLLVKVQNTPIPNVTPSPGATSVAAQPVVAQPLNGSTFPVSGSLGITSLPSLVAGSAAIGTVGVTSLPALSTGTNSIGSVTLNGAASSTPSNGGTLASGLNTTSTILGQYNTTPPTLTNGTTGVPQLDANGNLKVSLSPNAATPTFTPAPNATAAPATAVVAYAQAVYAPYPSPTAVAPTAPNTNSYFSLQTDQYGNLLTAPGQLQIPDMAQQITTNGTLQTVTFPNSYAFNGALITVRNLTATAMAAGNITFAIQVNDGTTNWHPISSVPGGSNPSGVTSGTTGLTSLPAFVSSTSTVGQQSLYFDVTGAIAIQVQSSATVTSGLTLAIDIHPLTQLPSPSNSLGAYRGGAPTTTLCDSGYGNCANAGNSSLDAQATSKVGMFNMSNNLGFNGTTWDRTRKDTYAAGPQWTSDGGASGFAVASAATSNAIKSGAGRIARLWVTATGTGTATCYDSLTATGTTIFVIPASAPVGSIYALQYPFTTGLSCISAASGPAIVGTYW